MQRSRKVLTLTLVLALVFCALTAIPANAAEKTVSTADELIQELEAADNGDEIVLGAGKEFVLTKTLYIKKAITLRSANPADPAKITAAPGFSGSSHAQKNLIIVIHNETGNTTIKDLIVADSLRNGIVVQGTAAPVFISNVTIRNTRVPHEGAAIVVNGSNVTVSDITTSGNGWGAINVDQPGALLTIAGTLNIAEEVKIWTELDVSDAPNSNNPIKDETNSWTFTKDASDNIVYSPKKYTVTFDSNEGSDVPAAAVEHGSLLTLPAAPTKLGFTFDGWYTDEAFTETFDPAKAVTDNITLYANWTEKTFTVTYNTNGGSEIEKETMQEGKTATEPAAAPRKANYAFVGWYSDEALTKPFDFTTAVSADITLYAKWAVNWKNPFNDVKYGQWYYDDIQFVHMNAIVNGMSKTTFAPNLKTDRAMAITVLYRAAGSPAASGTFTFKDVPADSYYEDAVKWAVENKITDGYSATQFAPRDLVTREQLATMLYRFEKIGTKTPAVVSPDKTFKDGASVSDYAKEAVKALTTQGIINGMNDETFAPRGAATRAQVAAMVHRYLDAVK